MKKLTITLSERGGIYRVEIDGIFVTLINYKRLIDFEAKYIFLWVIMMRELGVSLTDYYDNRY